ncbi:MAG: alpha/beta fold hydrolase [Anaerolineales bacterium]
MTVERSKCAGWPVFIALLALLLSGCSTAPSADATPSPTVIPTAASQPSGTPAPSPVQPEQPLSVSFVAADGVQRSGRLFVSGENNDIGVVLAHMGAHGADQSSWTSFAELIALQGFGALTFNFRTNRSTLAIDVLAAIEFLRDQGYQHIVCIGASMGGTACLKAAMNTDLAGGVVISSLWTTGSGPTGGELVVSREDLAGLRLPLLFVSTENDGNGVPDAIKDMYEAAPEPKALKMLPGSAHGTDIFATHQGDELRDLLLDFLDNLR